ncbi:MAG: HAMP domain-containing histidine kinase [Lachnospiraceae bacterium]|nr:HAMP domain-containing histidine kinase [Lachnospiraceae bacterium]
MKFLYKILLWNIVIMAVAFGIGGYIFVNFVFNTSMYREIKQAMDDSSILQFAFETAALNIPSRYDMLQDTTIEEIGHNLENGGQGSGRLLRISDEEKQPIYTSEGFVEDMDFLMEIAEDTRIYRVIPMGEKYYIQSGARLEALDRVLYLETMKDVTQVFEERTEGFAVYRKVILVVLACATVVMFVICTWLTKPIRLLTKATRKMTAGDYSYRAKVISNDEMGQLTSDFNQMANALENNINMLEEEVRAREDFIAAFSHELKTPLTAIIGYADMLRSRKLDEEKHFVSANYIYTEGKRLETMAFRLLDLIVTKRIDVERQSVNTEVFFKYLKELYGDYTQVKILCQYETAMIRAESNLLKSVLINLVDNACKASREGGRIEIIGRKLEAGYLFAVKDYGVGIPEEECSKITGAFYMVDKSRSRSRNGAGLGLALCVEILKLHNAELKIESKLGEGSRFSFVIPWEEVPADA